MSRVTNPENALLTAIAKSKLAKPQEMSAEEKNARALYTRFAPYRVDIPEGRAGPWAIERFETTLNIEYLRCVWEGREPGLGVHTRLIHDRRGVVMSDTAAEIRDHRWYLSSLTGDVLITGLGLGAVVHALLTIPERSAQIRSITVIEKDADVIALSAAHYRKDPRVRVVHADAHTWQPRSRKDRRKIFDSAWHDIWDDICEDNRELFKRIRQHYARYMSRPKHQFCWGEAYLRRRG